MKTLVLGASGATGRFLVEQLLNHNIRPKIVVRSQSNIGNTINNHIEVVEGDVDDFSLGQFEELLNDCDSIVSCLGHNISLKGVFGKPRRLVFNAVKKIAMTLNDSRDVKKFILMSTTAYTDYTHGEKDSVAESLIFSTLRLLMPPHTDNVLSGDYLFRIIGATNKFEWVVVRPDSLFDSSTVSEYEVEGRRERSPVFDPGKTSRINVAHFMAELLSDDTTWNEWKYKAPVIYNKD